jgi:outer membrane biosynthesis protein TonB
VFDIRSKPVELPDARLTRRIGPRNETPIMPPVPILIDRQAPAGQSEANISGSEILLDLTIDSAGKVRSAQSNDPLFDASLKEATARWKFIPAFNGRDPIASRIYLFVSPKR